LSGFKARLFKVRASLVEASPFLGSLVLKLPILITEDPHVDAACVTGQGICYFGKGFLEALDLPELRCILLHEALHLALDAFPRCGNRKPLRWNLAHDFAINLLIEQSKLPTDFLHFPEAFRPLLDPQFKGSPAEEIYERLPEDLADIGLCDSDCLRDAVEGMTRRQKAVLGRAAGLGFDLERLTSEEKQELRGALGKIVPRLRGPLPQDLDPCDVATLERLRSLFPIQPVARPGVSSDLWFELWSELSQAEQHELRDTWREKLLEAAEQAFASGQSIGNLPDWAQKLLGPILTPQVPWQVRLAQKVHGHLRGERRSFARPGRRSNALGVSMPGSLRDRGPVGVFVDVSGSIGPQDLGAFLGEISGILRDARSPVRLITWDVEVQEDLLWERPEDMPTALQSRDLKLVGGGGTNPRCVIRHLEVASEGELPQVSFGVLLTDGYVPWPRASDWPIDLIVVCTSELPEPALGYDALRINHGESHD